MLKASEFQRYLSTKLPLKILKLSDRILSGLVFWMLNLGMALHVNSKICPVTHNPIARDFMHCIGFHLCLEKFTSLSVTGMCWFWLG